MANTELQDLTQGTLPKYIYGTNQSNQSRKYNALGFKNVKDYGAVGDGVTDDTASIQAAVDDANAPYDSANRGVIYFPAGTYNVTASIDFELADGVRRIGFLGAHGAKIVGSVNGALLKRSANTPAGAVCTIENCQLENTHSTGIGILFHSLVGGSIRNCDISAWRGIETYNSQSITIEACALIRATGTKSTSVGIVAGNATSIIATDASSYGKAVTHQNSGLVIIGGRFETNDIGIVLGEDENGNTFQSGGALISGLSMEANGIGIHCRAAVAARIGETQITSGVQITNGILVTSAQVSSFENVSVSSSGGFTASGIEIGGATDLAFRCVTATSWDIGSGGQNGLTFEQTNFPGMTVAELPIDPQVGDEMWVTDASSPTVGNTVTGGSTTDCIVKWAPSGAWKVVAI